MPKVGGPEDQVRAKCGKLYAIPLLDGYPFFCGDTVRILSWVSQLVTEIMGVFIL